MCAQTPNTMFDSSSSSSSSWFLTNKSRLRFFSRIRRFLYAKTVPSKRRAPSDRTDNETPKEEPESMGGTGDDYGTAALQRSSVKKLHFGRTWEEKEAAATEIRRLAAEGGVKVRKSLAELGVIPALVSMIMMGDLATARRRRLAVQALIELADGTSTNKALIVEAGILSKLPDNIDDVDEQTMSEFMRLFMFLTSLVNTQFPLLTTRLVPFLLGILESTSISIETKESCLGALYNLSLTLDNMRILVTGRTVQALLRMTLANEVAEKALATLGNLVVTQMGKKAIENDETVPKNLIGIMAWEEKPKCQELCAYILMVLAHQSSAQREKMAKAGIVPVLLEVALLGSPLAQKRALKLLQWFKDERGMPMAVHSGPQARRMGTESPLDQRVATEGKRTMKNLVRQSLHKNMEVITRRANGVEDASNLKALIVSASSKSLPY